MGGNIRQLGVAGFNDTYNIHWNWSPARFYETAVKDEGAEIAKGGALVVKTGKHTGRSALDKFVVRDEVTEDKVWWEATDHISTEQFDALREDFEAHMKGLTLYGQDTFGGADPKHIASPFKSSLNMLGADYSSIISCANRPWKNSLAFLQNIPL